MREAFEAADYRMALSGTPFRSDNNPIPFVSYEGGRSKADFEYSYGEALADEVCRPVIFPSFEGEVKWLSHTGLLEDWSLLDPLSREKEAERWRATLQPEGGWLRGVLSEADQALSAMRAAGHIDAAGLVFAIDQEHARRIATVLRDISGTEPVVAISDDPTASEQIKRFAAGRAKWIICVRMISEGVDIPRLRVGVFATNISTELFFRQAVGRFVRVIDGLEEQSVQFYIPAIEMLVKHALTIEEERDHQLFTGEPTTRSSLRQGEDGDGGEASEAVSSAFTPLSSDSRLHEMICDGGRFNENDLRVADQVKSEMGLPIPAAQVAALLKRGASQSGVFVLNRPESEESNSGQFSSIEVTAQGNEHHSSASSDVQQSSMTPQIQIGITKYGRKKALRHETSSLANRLAGLLGFRPWQIHKQWKDSGGMPQGEATEDDLKKKREWLSTRIREEIEGRSRGARNSNS
jgi:superfamily II DNA or RNA helicase